MAVKVYKLSITSHTRHVLFPNLVDLYIGGSGMPTFAMFKSFTGLLFHSKFFSVESGGEGVKCVVMAMFSGCIITARAQVWCWTNGCVSLASRASGLSSRQDSAIGQIARGALCRRRRKLLGSWRRNEVPEEKGHLPDQLCTRQFWRKCA